MQRKNKNFEIETSLTDITNSFKESSEILGNTESSLRRVYKTLDKVVYHIENQTEAINNQTVEISK